MNKIKGYFNLYLVLFVSSASAKSSKLNEAIGGEEIAGLIVILLLLLLFIGGPIYIWKKSKGRAIKAKLEIENKIKKENALKNILKEIEENDLPNIGDVKIILKKGEIAHFKCNAELYELKTTGYKHRGTSVRVRIFKGVSVGTGIGKSTANKEFIPVSKGQLVMTNQRVAFAGEDKSFEMKLANITYYEGGQDYITFHAGARKYTLVLDLYYEKILEKMLDKLLRSKS